VQDPIEPNANCNQPVPNNEGWWTRDHALTVVLVAVTAILLYLCWQLVRPFLGAIAWALALAIVARPVHRWMANRMKKRPGLAASLAVALIAIVIIAPAAFVGQQLVKEASSTANTIQEVTKDGKWRENVAQKSPRLGAMITALEQNGPIANQVQSMAGAVGKYASGIVTGSAWAVVELLLTLFILFFLFRDREQSVRALRSLVPLSGRETNEIMTRVSDTVHATVYGTLVVAAIQGTLGGLIFWWLSLPAPILWGAVMAVLAIIPVLGAFVVWVPAAIFLAATGQVGKAVILAAWGAIVVGLIDNLLYPVLVGKRLRMHTVPVFFSIVGGLMFFGAAGLVLGPVVLALAAAVLDIWRRRTAQGKAAETRS
jgi:predicted PurR-regulated permease PerM